VVSVEGVVVVLVGVTGWEVVVVLVSMLVILLSLSFSEDSSTGALGLRLFDLGCKGGSGLFWRSRSNSKNCSSDRE